ncbi:hypothetical protein ACOMHN_020877 [Nucella lapillus]
MKYSIELSRRRGIKKGTKRSRGRTAINKQPSVRWKRRTEPLLSKLLKERNIAPSEYFSVDEVIVMTRGDCNMHRAINFSNCDQPGL